MRVALLGLGAILLVLLGLWLSRKPAQVRDWAPDQAISPRATIAGDSATIEGVRNFRWTGPASFTPAWETRRYDLRQLASVWYVLVPFSQTFRGPAHAFVSFGFDDGRYLSLSVEARREAGETYGVFTGLLRKFELIYVAGDEQDVIGRRAVYDDDDVYLYPIRASREAVRGMFVAMLERMNALHDRPEFYNTLTNNCTLNLVHHVNQLSPGLVPGGWRILLPGYSDVVVQRLGLIDSTLPLETARRRFRINDRARAALDSPDFSAAIRRAE